MKVKSTAYTDLETKALFSFDHEIASFAQYLLIQSQNFVTIVAGKEVSI